MGDMNWWNDEVCKGMTIEKLPDSPILLAKKQLYIPEKKIILGGKIDDKGSLISEGEPHSKGGLIV